MNCNTVRNTRLNVCFNEITQVITIERLAVLNPSYRAWYNADEISRFRRERRGEVEALKHNQDEETSSISLRGIEQIVYQPSQLRIMSRTMFIRKVLDQQEFEQLKTNTDSRVEDRLAAKVRRWSMASVDQAIMRAQVGATESQGNWSLHPVNEHDTQMQSWTCSASTEMVRSPIPTHTLSLVSFAPCYPEDIVVPLTKKSQLAYTMAPSLKRTIQFTHALNLQGISLKMKLGTAKCA